MTINSPGWFPAPLGATSTPGWVQPADDLTVRLGTLSFATSHATPPPSPGSWLLSLHAIGGWEDAADDETPTTPHASGDGLVAGARRLGRRSVILTGLLIGTAKAGPGSPAEAADALARQARATLYVAEDLGLAREADVRLAQKQITRIPGAAHLARFTLTLTADDPLRYGSSTRALTNGANALMNRGDMTAWPLIELTGPHNALTITHPGGTFTFPALASGSRTIDCRNGAVWNGSTRVTGASGGWPKVPAGGGSWTVSGLGAGTATLRRFEAWS